jgi:tetratricopeptide (TPR) repeat protein
MKLHGYRSVLGIAVALATGVACGAGAPTTLAPEQVRDLPYGHALYDFFQQRYFASATDLLVALEKDRLKHHRDEGELLLGGLYVSYGLFNEAEQIFSRLIERLTSADVANRAWFHLAEIFYQKNLNEQALRAIQRITAPLPGELESRKLLLLANLHMLSRNYAGAVNTLSTLRDNSIWGLYGRYNLGVALIKLGRYDEGKLKLREISELTNLDREQAALRDKSNLALGFAALQQQRPGEAREAFRRLRLQGVASNAGLFGIGQAYFEGKDYEEALKYWTELEQRSVRGPGVFEALLAVPQTYAVMKVYPAAVRSYEKAIAVYDSETLQLDQTINDIRQADLFAQVLQRDISDELAALWDPRAVPDSLRQHFITELFASHEFTDALRNYRDLRFYSSHLRQWLDNMSAFDNMLTTRQRAFEERLPVALQAHEQAKPEDLARRYQSLVDEVQNIARNDDALALAGGKERQALERLQGVDAKLASLSGRLEADQLAELQDKTRILRGRLLWDVSADFKPRLHDTRKSLKGLDKDIARAVQIHAALKQAGEDEPAKFLAFRQRIDTLRSRTEQLVQRVDQAAADQEQTIRELALQRLEQQKQRLSRYKTQAQFELAQVYDLLAEREHGINPAVQPPDEAGLTADPPKPLMQPAQ